MAQSEAAGRPRAPSVPPDAHALAVEVLAFLAADEERLGRFLTLTGSTPQSLRQAAEGPGFTDAVLSYLAADEALLVAFASDRGYPPDLVGRMAFQERDAGV